MTTSNTAQVHDLKPDGVVHITNVSGGVFFWGSDGTNLLGEEKQYGCWGFMTSETNVKLQLGQATHIAYLPRVNQIQGIKYSDDYVINDYLKIVAEAGVANFAAVYPSTEEELFDKGIHLDLEYPYSMIVGIFELYRNLIYHPVFVEAAVYEHRRGVSAGASLILPRLLGIKEYYTDQGLIKVQGISSGRNAPYADAIGWHYGDIRDVHRDMHLARADFLSKENVEKATALEKKRASTLGGDYTKTYSGVFAFFVGQGRARVDGELKELEKQLIGPPFRARRISMELHATANPREYNDRSREIKTWECATQEQADIVAKWLDETNSINI